MIVIKKTGRRIEVKGHAGFGESGKDIVCAAVSGLFNSMVLSAKRLTKDKFEFSMNPGGAFISFEEDLSAEAKLLVSSFFIGVGIIAESHEGSICIIDPPEDVGWPGNRNEEPAGNSPDEYGLGHAQEEQYEKDI